MIATKAIMDPFLHESIKNKIFSIFRRCDCGGACKRVDISLAVSIHKTFPFVIAQEKLLTILISDLELCYTNLH